MKRMTRRDFCEFFLASGVFSRYFAHRAFGGEVAKDSDRGITASSFKPGAKFEPVAESRPAIQIDRLRAGDGETFELIVVDRPAQPGSTCRLTTRDGHVYDGFASEVGVFDFPELTGDCSMRWIALDVFDPGEAKLFPFSRA